MNIELIVAALALAFFVLATGFCAFVMWGDYKAMSAVDEMDWLPTENA